MPISVAIFNANTFGVNVSVNNGSPFSIGPTSAPLKYRPMVPGTTPAFTMGSPTPGTIGIGNNVIAITPLSQVNTQLFPFTISAQLPLVSLQIYIFWNQNQVAGSCVAFFANNGQIFLQTQGQAGGVTFDEAAC